MLPICLTFVGSGLGDVSLQGLILILIGCICAGLVLLEVANEFWVDTDGTGDDAHDVLGECSGLVSVDDRGIHHGLTRAEDTD